MAPSPSSPFSRSLTKATALSRARARGFFGKNGSTTRRMSSIAAKTGRQGEDSWAPEGQRRIRSGSWVNSSRTPIPRGFLARGFFTCSTKSGTITVRAQYDTLSRWNGNHRGSSITSTGITGTAFHGTSP